MLGLGAYEEGLLAQIGILSLLALSVYVILATGQLSLGNAAFMALGAYLTGVLTVNSGLPLVVALLIAAAAAGVLGAAVGFPALRLRGIYLAMATLALGEIVRTFFLNFEPTGATRGFFGMNGVSLEFILGCLAVVLALVLLLERSSMWLQLRAVNDDEYAAEASGVSTTFAKTGAFAFGAMIAAVGGGLFAEHTLYIEPNNFGWLRSVDMVIAVILGGSTTAWGPVAGAAVLTLLPEVLRPVADWRMAVYGGLLVSMLIIRPEGLLARGMIQRSIERTRRLRPGRATGKLAGRPDA